MNKADTKRKMVPWEEYDGIINESPDLWTACLILSERCREKDKQIDFLQKDNARMFFLLNPQPEFPSTFTPTGEGGIS